MENIQFAHSPNRFYKDLHKEVSACLRSKKHGAYANGKYWTKAFLLVTMIGLSYAGILLSPVLPLVFVAYLSLGFSLLLLALNVAHDASHDSISRNRKLNRFLYQLGFALQGANGFLWQKRHLHEHHPFPNVPDRDPDLINVKWLRYASTQPFRKYHAWQRWYAPLLYAVYTLYWIFIKDFSLSGTPVSKKIFVQMILVNLVHKAAYLFVFLFLPVQFNGFGFATNLLAFLCMHVLVSLFLVFTFAMSHYISGQPETKVENGMVDNSWEMHQVASSVDFHVEKKWALFVFGGFNCHVAHHLFPSVSHIHYPEITRLIYRHLESVNIQARQITFLQGINLHFKLLKEMSVKEKPILR